MFHVQGWLLSDIIELISMVKSKFKGLFGYRLLLKTKKLKIENIVAK